MRFWKTEKIRDKKFVYEKEGNCPCCNSKVFFRAKNTWFRDYLLCSKCGCIPRERALMKVIENYYPDWRKLTIHESSPAKRGASIRLRTESPNYTSSQYNPKIALGSIDQNGFRNENLEKIYLDDESVDLFITQDVLEHIFDINSAFKEIARVLKSGGAHIFTTPLVNFTKPTEVWARFSKKGQIDYLHELEYHGNPIDPKGSLVTFHYGYDICNRIFEACGLFTTIIQIDDLRFGIRAEYNEVLITHKK